MSLAELVLTVVTGLAINECCDASPAMARALVRWSARHHYADGERAAVRAEELAAYINDRPGKLFKLAVAAGFAARAAIGPRDVRSAANAYQPAPPPVIEFRAETGVPAAVIMARRDAIDAALRDVEQDIRAASRTVCHFGNIERRLTKLAAAASGTSDGH